MWFRLLADLIVTLHFAFILFVALGALLVLIRNWVIWLHLPALTWGVLAAEFNLACPLTPLEKVCRALGGQSGYAGGFIDYYLLPIIYSGAPSRTFQILIGALAVVLNAGIYAVLFFKQRTRSRQATPVH